MTAANSLLNEAITSEALVLIDAINEAPDMESIIARQKNPIAEIIFNNYLKYFEKKYLPLKSKSPSVSALRNWTLERNLPSSNTVLYKTMQILENDALSTVPMIAKIKNKVL